MSDQNYAVIMAGGIGSRFWPISRTARPKQFIDILGRGTTLLQATYNRMERICPAGNILVVTNERYRELTLEQLPNLSPDAVLCEPLRKNTAPCLMYANAKIKLRDPSARIFVAPADHLIENEEKFIEISHSAMEYVADRDVLLTIGIKAGRPDTGYGYIHYDIGTAEIKKVLSFTEKPDISKARKFLESGQYSWNSGMFIWSLSSIDKAMKSHLKEMHEAFSSGIGELNGPGEESFISGFYNSCESISIDYAVMEKSQNVEVINADIGWSDLGTWGSLFDHVDRDEYENALLTKTVLPFNSGGNIVRAADGKLVVLQGMNDYIIVDCDDALLICKKEDEQKIREIVEYISSKKGSDYV